MAVDIVGLGLATVDVLTRTPRLPGSNEVFEVDTVELQGGGPVATALAAAAKLGSRTAMVGSTDTGPWGEMIARELRELGVDTSQLQRREIGQASRSVILIEATGGERSILYAKGSVAELSAEEVPRALVQKARVLHLDGSHVDAALTAAAVARDAGTLVSLDGGDGEPWPGVNRLLPLVDVLVVARGFARNVTGIDDPVRAARELARHGAREVVITDGPRGAWYLTEEERGHVPAFPIAAIDTTGAGDSFHGAYLHGLLEGRPIEQRVRFASAVAAQVCGSVGGRTGLPDLATVEAFLEAKAAG